MMEYIKIIGILAVIVLIAYIILRVILNKTFTKTEVIEFVFDAILWAEENIVGTNMGKEKLSYVCGKLNSYLPVYLQPIITAKKLEEFANEIFNIMKEELAELKEAEYGNA